MRKWSVVFLLNIYITKYIFFQGRDAADGVARSREVIERARETLKANENLNRKKMFCGKLGIFL